MAVVYASGVLTISSTPLNTETVTIGGKVYTYQTTLTNVDGNVLIGGSAAAALANLKAAINLEAGAGTTYAAATVVNPHAAASAVTATTLTVKSKVPGAIGNFIATTETIVTGGSWGAATLTSGSGSLHDDILAYILVTTMPASVEQQLKDWADPRNLG